MISASAVVQTAGGRSQAGDVRPGRDLAWEIAVVACLSRASLLVGRSSCVLRNIVKLHRDDSPSGNPQAGATNRWGLEPIVLVQDPRLLEEEIAAVIGVTGEAAGAIEATDDSMISQDDSNERAF